MQSLTGNWKVGISELNLSLIICISSLLITEQMSRGTKFTVNESTEDRFRPIDKLSAGEISMSNKAPELRVDRWIDSYGNERSPVTLDELGTRLSVIYCFQHWCAGCHTSGFPMLRTLVDELEPQGVGFAVVQTVFEGFDENTFARLHETQQRYGMHVPFGHDGVKGQYPTIMHDYQTRGTPWFILINADREIVFSDFQINGEKLIESFQNVAAPESNSS